MFQPLPRGGQVFCSTCAELRRGRRIPRSRAPHNPQVVLLEALPCRGCGAHSGEQCVTKAATFAPFPHKERCEDAGVPRMLGKSDRASINATRNARRAKNKRRVFEHYGERCACCGTTEDLVIDHVNGDGKEHRAEIGDASHIIYGWLIKNDFPPGFQALCRQCNTSKRGGDRCRRHSAGPPRVTVRMDSAERVAAVLIKHMPSDQLARLLELLANSSAACTRCQKWESDCQCPAA